MEGCMSPAHRGVMFSSGCFNDEPKLFEVETIYTREISCGTRMLETWNRISLIFHRHIEFLTTFVILFACSYLSKKNLRLHYRNKLLG